jgi:HEAT repeat protein
MPTGRNIMQINNSTELLIDDLLSPDPDTAARAASALYALDGVAEVFADAPATSALLKSVSQGNRTAASVLLLGYCAGAEPLLHQLASQHGNDPVKLKPWSRLVSLATATEVALSRQGDTGARSHLLAELVHADAAVRVFLLDVLGYIDAPEIWHALATYLQDEQEIPEGVPSGAARRRLCDHAVDAFVAQLSLPVSFVLQPGGRYTAHEIAEVTERLVQSVPR